MTQPAWFQLTVEAPQEVREALALLLTEWGAGGVVEETRAVSAYFPPAARAELDARLERYAGDLGQRVVWSWSAVTEGWEDAWKAHFRPAVLSRRLAVCPSWERFEPHSPDVRVIRMDPGRAFGTGTHETTRLCLGLLDDAIGDAPPPTLLDVGCGSGILTVGARLLGVPRAVALDIDPLAASATRENALGNGVADGVLVLCGDLRSVGGAYPLVVANILYQVLLGLAPALAARVAPGGRLVLSGMLTPELASAAAVYGAQGLQETRLVSAGEWGALVFQRRPAG
ncbi:MAG: 50S ribosomal protein L11 methyltransferase [Proteobacteria bacterium]|nr:50S ribosomal protein L11 methyltransferase [Pseudomonadota bacterium]